MRWTRSSMRGHATDTSMSSSVGFSVMVTFMVRTFPSVGLRWLADAASMPNLSRLHKAPAVELHCGARKLHGRGIVAKARVRRAIIARADMKTRPGW